jgi:hypothetical protein
MKTMAKTTMIALAAGLATLVPTAGCSKKPVQVQPPPPEPSRNAFLGSWEGKDKNGDSYAIRFTADLTWESRIVEGGTERPHYRGTYEPQGTSVRLKVTEEGDEKTFSWKPENGNVPPNIAGSITGGSLKIGNVLTELELKRR